MNRMNHLDQVDYIAQLADLKQALYHNSLLINALIEVLVEKEMMTARDIAAMSAQLDASYTPQPIHPISIHTAYQADTSIKHPPEESMQTQSVEPLTQQPSTDPAHVSQSVDASFTHQLMDHIRAPHPAAAHSLNHPPADPTL